MDLEKRKAELLEKRDEHLTIMYKIEGAIALLNEQLNPPEEGSNETQAGDRQDGDTEIN